MLKFSEMEKKETQKGAQILKTVPKWAQCLPITQEQTITCSAKMLKKERGHLYATLQGISRRCDASSQVKPARKVSKWHGVICLYLMTQISKYKNICMLASSLSAPSGAPALLWPLLEGLGQGLPPT